MLKTILAFLFSASTLMPIGCGQPKRTDQMSDDELAAYAQELAKELIIVDGHIDLPDALKEKKFMIGVTSADTLVRTTNGEFDYERAKEGGLDAPFMSIYIPVGHQDLPDRGKGLADSLINTVTGIVDQLPDKFALATKPADVEANLKEGKISLPMGMENGAPIGDDLGNLKYFFDRGVRYITLTHNKDNQICDSSRDTTHTWNGLSPFGRQVVLEMNKLGIMVDISHVDDSTFYQVMELSKAPAIASHSSCRRFSPTAKRDMTDDMIRSLGQQGGVMMINFYTSFLDSAAAMNSAMLNRQLADLGLRSADPAAKPVISKFRRDHPSTVNVETVANHIDHVVSLAGIDHVGIGSDYDGVNGELPVGLEDVSKYPNLIYELLKRGYTEDDIAKICYQNIFRVWNKAAEIASQMQTEN